MVELNLSDIKATVMVAPIQNFSIFAISAIKKTNFGKRLSPLILQQPNQQKINSLYSVAKKKSKTCTLSFVEIDFFIYINSNFILQILIFKVSFCYGENRENGKFCMGATIIVDLISLKLSRAIDSYKININPNFQRIWSKMCGVIKKKYENIFLKIKTKSYY